MMKKLLLLLALSVPGLILSAQEFNRVPFSWKWVSDSEAVFSYDGSFNDSTAFAVVLPALRVLPAAGTNYKSRII